MAKSFLKNGIEIFTGHKVEGVETNKNGVSVRLSSNGEEKALEADQALVAIGFRPNSVDLGLNDIGVELDQKGFIKIDDRQSTNVPGIWAVGDVTGKMLLAHVASTQGVLCADAISGKETQPIDYQMIPAATYCHPQVASFGMTESEAIEAGFEVKVGRFNFQANGKALGLAEGKGFIKLLTDTKYGEILGAHLIGPEVSELLPELDLKCNVVSIPPLLRELILFAVTLPKLYEFDSAEERILMVIQDQLKTLKIDPLDLRLPQDDRLQVIYQHLTENPANNRTLEAWGKKIGSTSRTLTRLFSKEIGMSFGQWRQQINARNISH